MCISFSCGSVPDSRSQLIICRGIPASGKSTGAKQWVNENPKKRVRINMDDIRNMLGKYWVPEREPLVSKILANSFLDAISLGYDIVLDNTNLNYNAIKYYIEIAKENKYVVKYWDFFDTPLSVCLERDSKREHPIGERVIRSFYNRNKDKYPLNGN